MIRIIKSEFYRLKHTAIIWVHLILPIVYATFYFFLAKTTGIKNFPKEDVIEIFLVLLSVIFPIIIGAITAKVSDLEMNAGNFQVMLSSTKSRTKAYICKLIVLMMGSLFSTAISVIIFGMLFKNQRIIDYFIEMMLVFVGTLGIYIINLWVSIAIGAGASLGLGFFGTLLAGLSMTVLGDKIWYFIPYSWPSRLSLTYLVGNKLSNSSIIKGELLKFSFIAILIVVVLLLISTIWFNKWDGKPYMD